MFGETKSAKLDWKQLQEANIKYQTLINSLSVGVILIAPDFSIVEKNMAIDRWFPDFVKNEKRYCYQLFQGSTEAAVGGLLNSEEAILHSADLFKAQARSKITGITDNDEPSASSNRNTPTSTNEDTPASPNDSPNDSPQTGTKAGTEGFCQDEDGSIETVAGGSEHEPCNNCHTEKAFKTGKASSGVRYIMTGQGLRYFRVISTPLQDDAGAVYAVMETLEDITEQLKTAGRLKQRERFLDSLLDTVPIPIFYKDSEGRYLGCNQAFERVVKIKESELVGKTAYDISTQELADVYFRQDAELLSMGGIQTYESEILDPSGNSRQVIFSKAALEDDDGKLVGIIGAIQDVTEIRETERVLRESEIKLKEANLRFKQLAVQSRSITWEVNLDGRYTYISSNVAQEWGYRPDELVGRLHFYDLHPEPEREIFKDEGMKILRSGENITGFENPILTKDGRVRWVMSAGMPEQDSMGNIVGFKGIDTDITAFKEAEQQIRYLATHDHLTGLPGLSLARERMSQALGMTRRRGDMLAIMFVDLDRFKLVNDNWGHDAGDLVLRTVADRMRMSLRATDTAARIGGDEFVVMASSLVCKPDAQKIADKIERSISLPIDIGGEFVSVGVSIGIAMYPEDGADVEELIKTADTAMYMVKARHSDENFSRRA